MGNEISLIEYSLIGSKFDCKFSWFGTTIEYSVSFLTYIIEKQHNYDIDMNKDILRLINKGFSLRQTLGEMYIIRLTILNKMHADKQYNEGNAWCDVFGRMASVVENPIFIIEEYEKEIEMIMKNVSEQLPLPIADEVIEHMYDHYSMEKIKKTHKSIEKYYDIFDEKIYQLLKKKYRIRLGTHNRIIVDN